MLEYLKRHSLIGLALGGITAAFLCCLCSIGSAQMTGPRAINLDPMHTTQPICDAAKSDGVDIAAPTNNAPVLAPVDGVVSARWNDTTYGCGLTLMIDVPDGSVAGLAGLSSTSVKVGDKVQLGEIIAWIGKSDSTAPSATLHFTLWTKEEGKINPMSKIHAASPDAPKLLTDPATLQQAFDKLNALDLSDKIKKAAREQLLEKFYADRKLAAAEYKDTLDKAADAWYANQKDWRKIPASVWDKLSDADKGRFKIGIDPETVAGR